MPQFFVRAWDGDDADAPARRLAVRARHFELIQPRIERGEIVSAGALLDEAGTMIGSVALTEFADRAALDAWLAEEPYMNGDVWRKVEVTPLRIAVRDGKATR